MALRDFAQCKNWAVVGDVLNTSKYAARIRKELVEDGYAAAGVHPKGGDDVCVKLADVAASVEVMDLCINPALGMGYMHEAAALGIRKVLLQPGASSPEILAFGKENGMECVEGCALVMLDQKHGRAHTS